MSRTKLHADAVRWLAQANDDLSAAESLLNASKYAQACFYSHQAAEKAVKALGYRLDLDPWGHSIFKLISELPDAERIKFDSLRDDVLGLDKLYIPTRYPDSLGDLTPAEAYTQTEAAVAIARAKRVIQVASSTIDA